MYQCEITHFHCAFNNLFASPYTGYQEVVLFRSVQTCSWNWKTDFHNDRCSEDKPQKKVIPADTTFCLVLHIVRPRPILKTQLSGSSGRSLFIFWMISMAIFLSGCLFSCLNSLISLKYRLTCSVWRCSAMASLKINCEYLSGMAFCIFWITSSRLNPLTGLYDTALPSSEISTQGNFFLANFVPDKIKIFGIRIKLVISQTLLWNRPISRASLVSSPSWLRYRQEVFVLSNFSSNHGSNFFRLKSSSGNHQSLLSMDPFISSYTSFNQTLWICIGLPILSGWWAINSLAV